MGLRAVTKTITIPEQTIGVSPMPIKAIHIIKFSLIS